MSRIWRVISLCGAALVVIAGTLLLMGSLRNSTTNNTRLEQARLEALARSWEGRLESTRLFFHDQMVRHNVLAVLEHTEDWSDWRIKNKFDAVQSTWSKEDGTPRGFMVLAEDGRPQMAVGDTAGYAEAASLFNTQSDADIALLGQDGRAGLLVMDYRPVPLDENSHPASVIILLDASTLLPAEGNAPGSWALLSSPSRALMASSSAQLSLSVSDATWPLLLSEKTGVVPQSNGNTLCFVRLHIPGMEPLLLVESIAPRTSASLWLAFAVLALGTVGLVVAGFKRIPSAPEAAVGSAKPSEDVSATDATGFRQIFQAVSDPLCVIDSAGQVTRANRTAQEWLRLNKGRPDPNTTVLLVYGEMTIGEYLSKAVEDPAAVSGLCRFTSGESGVYGMVSATRLSRDEDGHGSVLIHFHPQPESVRSAEDRAFMPPEPQRPEVIPAGHDSHCPFPVMSVNPGGLITSFNDAARQTCPRLEETPLLSELLTGLDGCDTTSLLNLQPGTVFESLFGSGPHEFEIVHADDQILLYGHRLSASKKLEVELKQAQESFYTLCALSPSSVLLVDPRDHAILEANAAAADLFGFTPVDLRGQPLDALTAEPWDFAAAEELYVAASTTGRATRCLFRYELIKIEGMPTLLVVLEQLADLMTSLESAIEEEHVEQDVSPVSSDAKPALPIGPGLLVTMNPTVREVARRLFEKAGHPCEVFSSLDDATVWLITHSMRPELAAIDLTDFDEAETWIDDIRARCGDVPCIAFTDGAEYVLSENGQNEFLVKPFDLDALTGSLAALHLETSACES